MAALSGEDPRCAERLDHALKGQGHRVALAAQAPARKACTSCRKSGWAAARCRRFSLAQQHAADAHRHHGQPRRLDPHRAKCGRATGRRNSSRRFNVKAGGPGAAAQAACPGGNLQKFLVGREIEANPKLLIVSQPTWGVDVGAAAQIRGELLKLRDAGCALLIVSEELDELFEISDRLVVIAKGRMSAQRADRDEGRDHRTHRRMDVRPVGRREAGRIERRRAMLRLEQRGRSPRSAMSFASPLLALAVTVLIGIVLFMLLGKDPVKRPDRCFFCRADRRTLYALVGDQSMKATPLILIALGLSVCFRSNVWNIGAEGQFVLGAHRGRLVSAMHGRRPGWPGPAAGIVVADPARRHARRHVLGRPSSRCCATASTRTRSSSA